jgi:hypothetical protein
MKLFTWKFVVVIFVEISTMEQDVMASLNKKMFLKHQTYTDSSAENITDVMLLKHTIRDIYFTCKLKLSSTLVNGQITM